MWSEVNEAFWCLTGHLALLPEHFVEEGLVYVNWIDDPTRLGVPRSIFFTLSAKHSHWVMEPLTSTRPRCSLLMCRQNCRPRKSQQVESTDLCTVSWEVFNKKSWPMFSIIKLHFWTFVSVCAWIWLSVAIYTSHVTHQNDGMTVFPFDGLKIDRACSSRFWDFGSLQISGNLKAFFHWI